MSYNIFVLRREKKQDPMRIYHMWRMVMGRVDLALKKFIRKNDIFADLCNVFIFGGQTVHPHQLNEADPSGPEGRQRDVEKIFTVNKAGGRMMIGIENQNFIDCGMPLRAADYDLSGYVSQYRDHLRSQRSRLKGIHTEHFLSALTRNLRLSPVMTLVLYWGKENWDGPQSFAEMFSGISPELQPWERLNYRMNLVCIRQIPDAQINQFRSQELRCVVRFLQAAENPEKMKRLIRDNDLQSISDEAIDVINVLTDAGIRRMEGEKTDMCYAIDVIKKEYAAEQVAIVKAETEARVRKETEARVRKETEARVREETKNNLIADSFERMKENNPSLKDSDIIRFLAQIFGKSEKTIRRMIRRQSAAESV